MTDQTKQVLVLYSIIFSSSSDLLAASLLFSAQTTTRVSLPFFFYFHFMFLFFPFPLNRHISGCSERRLQRTVAPGLRTLCLATLVVLLVLLSSAVTVFTSETPPTVSPLLSEDLKRFLTQLSVESWSSSPVLFGSSSSLSANWCLHWV